MEPEELFDGVYKIGGKLATKNLVPGTKVYGEDIVKIRGVEYRLWNPYRSKLSAAILNGLKEMHIKRGSCVLYLGAATGTTCSHVSDIVGSEGSVYCVELSERSMRDLLRVCEKRANMLPILGDAAKPESYKAEVGTVDIIYQDVSSRLQAEILLRNAALLKRGGYAYIAIKSQSIDSAAKPEKVYNEFVNAASGAFELSEAIDIAPYTMLHLFVVMKKIKL
ncbi:MAG: fibrillarin-like rRNA/tRNA 2'-O-methyltransferase [Candidatus Micrarchaeaceae archaeon]